MTLKKLKHCIVSQATTEEGAQLLEFALALPILIAMLLGTIDIGRLAYVYIETMNAARAGVAYGAQNHVTASDTAGITNAALNDVSANVTGLTATPTKFCKCANGTNSPTCTISVCTGNNNPLVEFVQVDTTATYNAWFPVPGLPNTVTVNGQAIMRTGQ